MCTLVLLIFFTFLNILCPGYFVRSSSFSLFSVFVFLVYSQHLYFCFFTVMEIFLADESTYVVVMITFFVMVTTMAMMIAKTTKMIMTLITIILAITILIMIY